MTVAPLDIDNFIYDEMMVHPLFFTHPKAHKIAIIDGTHSNGLLNEALKHPQVKEVCLISGQKITHVYPEVKIYTGTQEHLTKDSFDLIIASDKLTQEDQAQLFFSALASDGILLQQSESFFELAKLKHSCETLQKAGFYSLQILHFPQPNFPSGWRSAVMAVKDRTFRRIREKDIFNKAFPTRYYNYDVHKAALVIPEFMREEFVF